MLQRLREKISLTDQILTESKVKDYSEEIDLNQDNWLEIARKQEEAFREEHSETVNCLTKEILDGLDELNNQDKGELIKEIRSTQSLKSLLNLTEDQDTIENRILLFIVTSSGIDSRDALLELNSLINQAKEKGVNYKSVIEEFLPFSDTMKSSEMGSMKEVLERII